MKIFARWPCWCFRIYEHYLNQKCTFFEGQLSRIISRPYVIWYWFRSHHRTSCFRHYLVIDLQELTHWDGRVALKWN